MLGIDDMNEERREVGRAYLEIPVVFFDGGQGFFPDLPYIRASEYSDRVHCGNQVASVSRVDDAYRIRQTHSRLTYA